MSGLVGDEYNDHNGDAVNDNGKPSAENPRIDRLESVVGTALDINWHGNWWEDARRFARGHSELVSLAVDIGEIKGAIKGAMGKVFWFILFGFSIGSITIAILLWVIVNNIGLGAIGAVAIGK